MSVPRGDPAALRERATALARAAEDLDSLIHALDETARSSDIAGDNSFANGIREKLNSGTDTLQNVANYLRTGSDRLTTLASYIEEAQADGAEYLAELDRSPGIFERLLGNDPQSNLDDLSSDAERLRNEVAAQFDEDAAKTVRTSLYHEQPSWWDHLLPSTVDTIGNYAGNVWDAGKETVTGIVGVVPWTWNHTARGLYDEDGFTEAWQGTWENGSALVDALGDDPQGFALETVRTVVNVDLLREDPAAWLTVIGIEILTTKGLTRLSRAGHLTRLTDATGELSNTARLLRRSDGLAGRVHIADLSALEGMPPTVWVQHHFPRGFDVETVAAHLWQQQSPSASHLLPNNPTIDLLDRRTGTVTSVKSIDPRLPTYSDNMAAFERKLQGDADTLAGYRGGIIYGQKEPLFWRDIGIRQLVIGVPQDGLSTQHMAILEELADRNRSVQFHVIVVP